MKRSPDLARLIRHLEFARTQLGEGAADLAAWLLISGNPTQSLWAPLGSGAAALLDVHERMMLGIGYHRRRAYRRAKQRTGVRPGKTVDLDRMEVSLVWSALDAWLPLLGDPGAVVHHRMVLHGCDAVLHHLIAQLSSEHPQKAVLEAAGTLRDASMALDTAIVSTCDLDQDVDALQQTRLSLEKRMIDDLHPSGEVLGWNALACMWIATFHGLGVSTSSLGDTQRFEESEARENGSFDLLEAYAALVG